LWAEEHVVGRDGAQRLLEAIADWCNDDGITFVGQKRLQYKVAPMPESSVKANFKYLKEHGYIRTEQRRNPVTKARMTDIIYLNLEKWDTQKISFEEAQKVMEQSGMTMDQLAKSPLFLKGAHQHYIDRHSDQGLENLPSSLMGDGPVENSINDQGLKNLPSSKSVDNSPKTQGLENLPSPTKVGLTGDQGRFDSSEGGPRFKRNARAQINLKIKDSSISQSVNSSGPVENSESTDRWMRIENSKNPQTKPTQGGKSENPVKSPQVAQGDSETSFVGKSSPVTVLGSQRGVRGSAGSETGQVGPAGAVGVVAARGSEAAERVHRGVDLERVKATLCHAGIPAMSIPATTFVRMIDLVLGRATAPVQSPNGYVTAAMKNGWGELLSNAQSQPGNEAGASSAAVCRQHRCYLSPAGKCKRCIAEQRAAELDEVQHELTWKRHLNQIDVAALEVSLRRAGCSVDALPVPVFGQRIMDALADGVSATTQGLYEFFKNHQEIFKTPVSGSAGIRV
jgi:hypothetical protein